MWSAIWAARRAPSSPGNITGVIGCDPGSSSNPASVISSRNRAALARNVSRAWLDPDTRSSAASDPATTAGATEFENR